MPCRISITHGRIERIAVPILTLRISWLRHHRIRLQKSPQGGIVEPRAVVHQAGVGVALLTGEGRFGVRQRKAVVVSVLLTGRSVLSA